MENNVPSSVMDQAVERTLREHRASATEEVRRLVAAALGLIQRTGELEPRVSQIVKQAGLHNQAFYRHFRSKHELLVAVLDQGVGLLASYLQHRMDAAATPHERVREWLRGMLEQALSPVAAEATRPFVLARGRLSEAYPDEVRESERQLTAPLREALRAGLSPDPEREAEILYLLAMGWIQNRLLESAPASRDDASALEAFAMAGLARKA